MKNNYVNISIDDHDCYFHFLGDKRKYYDIEAMVRAHPEYSMYIAVHKMELIMKLRHAKELLENDN